MHLVSQKENGMILRTFDGIADIIGSATNVVVVSIVFVAVVIIAVMFITALI
jgi:hypothetical protein